MAGEDDKILATTNGWVAPLFKYMHCEALQVFAKPSEAKKDHIQGGPLGLGLLVGVCTFAYAHEKGITRAEILAIKDYGAVPGAWQLVLQAHAVASWLC